MNQITILMTPFNPFGARTNDHKEVFSFQSEKVGMEAAELAFHLTNAPLEVLSDEEQKIIEKYKGRSLSVGDIVKVNDTKYLCQMMGWMEVS